MGSAEMSKYLALCQRCNGTGRYDRGACFGCRAYGAAGWVRIANKSNKGAQVTAIRDESEGRIDWVIIYNATPKQACAIVARQMTLAGKPKELIDSIAATALKTDTKKV
jgi:hypothetical protein